MYDFLYLDCPFTSFPRSFARDYKETYQYPPPSTLYGFLLSLVGEEDLLSHLGVKLAVGVLGEDALISRIVRKQRHHKFSKKHQGVYPSPQFSKPNFQELLTDLRIVLRLDSSEERASPTLLDRVTAALTEPVSIQRFGGLSLGESWALVNGVRPYRETDGVIRWLFADSRGLIGLPVWIDRKTTRGTFQRFSVGESDEVFGDRCWVTIQQPIVSGKSKK